MIRLHRGHPGRAGLAGAALVFALVASGPGPAAADVLGGEQLASPNRTVALLPGAEPLPPVKAATWILADAATGEVLAQKGSHVKRAPASTLKMLTALAVMPNTSPEDEYTATSRAAYIYGARVGLRPGKTYTLDQLWYAVFLPSANDAAIAVAEANGGVRRTVTQMNDVALELRALDTVARNTSGLDAPEQVSSAYDLALIAREGLSRQDFAHYAGTARATFPNVKGKGTHPIYTTNRLLLHGWKGTIGVKTGFTTRAGRTYVGAATRDGRTLIVALMGIRESSEDAARKLLSWGFENAELVEPVGALVEKGSPLPEPSPTAVASATAATGEGSGLAGGRAAGTDITTTAAAPTGSPERLPVGVLLGGLVIAAVAGAGFAVHRGSGRKAPGRHAA